MAIPAATFNTFVDAAQDFLHRQRSIAHQVHVRPVQARGRKDARSCAVAFLGHRVWLGSGPRRRGNAAARGLCAAGVAVQVERVYDQGGFAGSGTGAGSLVGDTCHR